MDGIRTAATKKEKKKAFIAWVTEQIAQEEALKLTSKNVMYEHIAMTTLTNALEKFKEIYE